MARPLPTILATALIAALAVAGCKKHENAANTPTESAASTTPATTPETAPPPAGPIATTPPPATAPIVSSVELGTAVGADNRVTSASTSFAKNDTIHASVATSGDKAATVTARWTYQDGQVVHSEDKSVPAGAQVTDFSIHKPDGWPAGSYKLEVLVDGNVAQSKDFAVK